MAFKTHKAHFLLFPAMIPGHLIPMIDIARLLAQQNLKVTIVTTPQNAARVESTIDRANQAGLAITFLQLRFPSAEAGLPEGCENIDSILSMNLLSNFIAALNMLQEPFERSLQEMHPLPSCIVVDKAIIWMSQTAAKFKLPRILFDGTSCFSALCAFMLHKTKVHENVSETEPFVVPGLPHQIELTRVQLSGDFNPSSNKDLKAFREEKKESEKGACGVFVNSFEELEQEYIKGYREATGIKVWCIGPVSLCNRGNLDKAQRGKKASIDEKKCLEWLDSWPSSSVIYVCFGSLNRLTPTQLIELGLALEESNRPFIWVIRGAYKQEEKQKWLEEYNFEKRVEGRGLLIRGWAPQVLILSHPAIGGFVTHCGWNSILEGISAGVPMITWPLFAEQFYNEKLIVQVLNVGVRVDALVAVDFGDEEKPGVLVKKEDIRKAIDKLMDGGDEGEERRKRVKLLAVKAMEAVEEGGSSYLNITQVIEDITQCNK